jgi:hypothetical protein
MDFLLSIFLGFLLWPILMLFFIIWIRLVIESIVVTIIG